MKSKTHIAPTVRTRRAFALFGAVAALATTIACSDQPKPAASSAQPVGASVRPSVLQTSSQNVAKVTTVSENTETTSVAKPVSFKSRDYGISFQYPWQYTRMSARTLAKAEDSMLPKADGFEGQFTLTRVDIPKGFYPDTNFESGYFTLSLNQDVSKEECEGSVGNDVKIDKVNGVEFRSIETENGGRGTASKVRNYVTYANYNCYEIELGVKTKNDMGLAREVDPDQVIRRLESILATVKVAPEEKVTVQPTLESSKASATPDSGN
jgi:hypothetical protein